VPVIDLDSPIPVAPERPVRWNPRALILAAAGLLLLSLPGENDAAPEPVGPSLCAGQTASYVLIDVDTGKLLQTTVVHGAGVCPGTTRPGS
jgi:hypothetical protein